MMSDAYVICGFEELTDPGSCAFTVGAGDWPLRGFLVRKGAEVAAFVNRCPHAGHPLNWRADQFLCGDGLLIQCDSHGALFDVLSGECVAGPCVGRALTKIDVRVEDGRVFLAQDVDVLARTHA